MTADVLGDDDKALSAVLCGIIRLFDESPAFVLPIFRRGPADARYFVQEFANDGRIASFSRVDVSDLSLQDVPQATRRSAGQPGLLAFEIEAGDVRFGERTALAVELADKLDLPSLSNQPFNRSALAEFCGDRQSFDAASLQALASLPATSRTRQYLRINVLIRSEIKRAYLEKHSGKPFPAMRLIEDNRGLVVELSNTVSQEQLEAIDDAVQASSGALSFLQGGSAGNLRALVVRRRPRTSIQTSIAANAITWPPQVTENEINRSLRELSEKILGDHPDSNTWVHNWLIAFRSPEADQEKLVQIARDWLAERPFERSWGNVWNEIVRVQPNQDETLKLGMNWLSLHIDHPSWPFVWLRITKMGFVDRSLIKQGHDWLQLNHSSRSWSYIWRQMLELESDVQTEVLALGQQWIQVRLDDTGWPFVWQKLLDVAPHPSLIEQGENWLVAHLSHQSWWYVWRRLVDLDTSSMASLLELGWRWVSENSEHPQWHIVWQALAAKASVRRLDVIATGLKWLSDHKDSDGWSFVWRTLVDIDTERHENLFAVGRDWLIGREDRKDWSHVWRKLSALDQRHLALLIQWGWSWLGAREGTPSWPYVWSRLVDIDYSRRQELCHLGFEWLDSHEERHEWLHVWRRTYDLGFIDRDRLVLTGLDWIRHNETSRDWPVMWQRVFLIVDGEARKELAERAKLFLQRQPTHDGWPAIWLALLRTETTDRSTLLDAGWQWLKAQRHSDKWPEVWGHILDFSPLGRDRLISMARDWIKDNPRHSRRQEVETRITQILN
ncbi:MAG: hypothetical protein KIT82_19860 [Bradyrhizobium sp.]|nr:hypothetical protein [Bradyrhizobium sp.]